MLIPSPARRYNLTARPAGRLTPTHPSSKESPRAPLRARLRCALTSETTSRWTSPRLTATRVAKGDRRPSGIPQMPSLHGYTMGTYKEEKVSEAVTRMLDPKTRRGIQKVAHIGSLSNVRLYVASSTSLTVHFDVVDTGMPAENFKVVVEWSLDAAFNEVVGQHSIEVSSVRLEYEITGLQSGTNYFVRVFSDCRHGPGDAVMSVPPHATPSSWRDVEKNELFDTRDFDVFLASLRREYKSMLIENQAQLDAIESSVHLNQPRKSAGTKRASWKTFFSSSARFQKTLKAGLYFVCVVYHEDRIVTNGDEHLPIMLVDGACPAVDQSLPADLLWLMRLSHAWSAVDELREKMERLSGAAGALELRLKMLRTASLLQTALGTQDLGQVFYKILEDEGSGAAAIVFVNRIDDIKSVGLSFPLKWLPTARLERRQTIFVDRLSDFICYHQVSSSPLSKGLYLGLMLTRTSVDSIYLLVNAATPNVMPNVKLRDRPHVSRLEWNWLTGRFHVNNDDAAEGRQFVQLVVNGFKTLAYTLGVRPEENLTYRLYDMAVLELSSDVSFLVFVPPRDSVCTIGGCAASHSSLRSSHMELPFKIFELVHLATYTPDLLRAYAEIAAHMDVDSQLAQHAARTALTSEAAAVRQAHLNNILWYQQQAEDRWQTMKWPLSVVAFARDRTNRGEALERLLSVLLADEGSAQSLSAAGSGRSSARRRKQRIADRLSPEGSRERISASSPETPRLGAGNNGEGAPSPPSPRSQRQRMQQVRPKTKQLQTAFVRVHAHYDCGLSAGTSVVLHVTQKTSCREVVNLVVQQLKREVQARLSWGRAAHPVLTSAKSDRDMQKMEQGLEDEEGEELEDLLRFCLVIELDNGWVVLQDDALLLDWRSIWLPNLLSVKMKADLDDDVPQGLVRFTAL